jgi:RNA polymerase sigma-70 factor (ECF subfamily)
VNISINFVNRNRKSRLLQSLEDIFHKPSNEKTPLEELEELERDQHIRKAIESLPETQRTAFILSKYEELSQKEIAKIMNKTEGAIEQLLQRAKNSLQKKLTTQP